VAASSGALRVSASRTRLPAIDGLRAIAALAVFAHHVGFDTGATFRGALGSLLARGDIGVPIFFAISGFVIYRPFAASHAGTGHADPTRLFYKRRFLRIYPAYWIALTVLALAFGVGIHGWRHAVALYGLLQIYRSGWALSGLPQAWSLCVEVSFYALIPAYAWAMGRLSSRLRNAEHLLAVELAAAGGLALVSLVYRALIYAADPSWAGTALFWLPAHLDLFAIGIALAAIVVHRPAHPIPVVERIAQHPGLCWAVAVGAYLATAYLLGLPKGLTWVPGPRALARQTLYAIVAAGLLLPAVLGRPGTRPHRLSSWAPLVWVGVVSYGVYLWHKTLVGEAVRWTGGTLLHANPFKVAAVALPVTLVAAWASHRFVEEPLSARFGRRNTRREPSALR